MLGTFGEARGVVSWSGDTKRKPEVSSTKKTPNGPSNFQVSEMCLESKITGVWSIDPILNPSRLSLEGKWFTFHLVCPPRFSAVFKYHETKPLPCGQCFPCTSHDTGNNPFIPHIDTLGRYCLPALEMSGLREAEGFFWGRTTGEQVGALNSESSLTSS